jgi:hypothetical protein
MYAHNYSSKRLSSYLFQSYANPTLPWTGIGVWSQNDRDDLTQNSVRTNMGGMQGMHSSALDFVLDMCALGRNNKRAVRIPCTAPPKSNPYAHCMRNCCRF